MVDRNFLYECDKCGKIFTTKEVLTENDMKIKKRVDLIDNVID
jgi:transcriptional regulator NrdR family protein